LVYLSESDQATEPENLGQAFFLRQDKKLYTEGQNIYITTPENLKIVKNQKYDSKHMTLQFFHRRVPHKVDCHILGRFRLLPEVIETLDFNAKAAFKLSPISRIKKEEKRFHKRYCLLNYGDSRIPLTTHVQFEVFIKNTNYEFPLEGAPPPLIKDLHTVDYQQSNSASFFTTKDVISEFRNLMLIKSPHERFVDLAKIVKGQASGLNKDEEYLLGQTNVLALEMESLQDVLYLKKSSKAVVKRGQDNPYNLHTGEKILTRFEHQRNYYEMLCEVMEALTQIEQPPPKVGGIEGRTESPYTG
jgi:hypothetical protein